MALDGESILLLSSIGTSSEGWVSINNLRETNQLRKAFALYEQGYLTTRSVGAVTHYGLTKKASNELEEEFRISPQLIPEEKSLLFRQTEKKPHPINQTY